MEIVINTDNVESIAMSAHCPKCQKTVEATILNEYDIYTELFHSVPECGAEWRFTSYKQCKMLQEALFKELSHKIYYEGEGKFERKIMKYWMTGVGFFGLIMISGGVGLIATLAIPGAFAVGNFVEKGIRKEQLRNALLGSYNIDKYFPELHLHYFDKKYNEERERNLNTLHEILNAPVDIACS